VPTPVGGHKRKMPAHLSLIEVDCVPAHLTAKSCVVVVPRVPGALGVRVEAQVVYPLLGAFGCAHHVVVARVHQNLEVVGVRRIQELGIDGHHGRAAVRHVVANGARTFRPIHGDVVFLRSTAVDVNCSLESKDEYTVTLNC